MMSRANVTVYLDDQNDNSPVFLQETYEAEIPENITKGTIVTQVRSKLTKNFNLNEELKKTESFLLTFTPQRIKHVNQTVAHSFTLRCTDCSLSSRSINCYSERCTIFPHPSQASCLTYVTSGF